jgi:Domain of unknown function (DUF4149)
MMDVMNIAALLTSALLFGGMMLYSFGFAPLVFSSLPSDVAGGLLRKAFPHYYVFVLVTAALAAALLWQSNSLSSGLMAAIAVIAIIARQMLMPAINMARDAGAKSRFNRLHGLSVALNMVQLAAVVAVLVRMA